MQFFFMKRGGSQFGLQVPRPTGQLSCLFYLNLQKIVQQSPTTSSDPDPFDQT